VVGGKRKIALGGKETKQPEMIGLRSKVNFQTSEIAKIFHGSKSYAFVSRQVRGKPLTQR
jgi:hypothetical protein